MVDEQKLYQRAGVRRYFTAMERNCSLIDISFKDLSWTDYRVRIIDLSVIGIGIASDEPIPSGIIWLKHRVFGQKCGSLVWCKQVGVLHRAGIQYMHLTRPEEEYLQKQIELAQPGKPIPDPDRVIAALIQDISNARNESARNNGPKLA